MSTNCPIAHWLARLSAQVVQAGARAAVAEVRAAEVSEARSRAAVAEAQARADFAEEEARAADAVAARATEESRVASRRAGRDYLQPWLGLL